MASMTATITSLVLHGFSPIIAVSLEVDDMFTVAQVPLFVLLGCFCGVMAYYFTSVNSMVGGFYNSMKSQWKKWLYAGISLGLLIFLFPPLYGEGHGSFGSLMSGGTDELFDNSLFYSFSDADWFIIIYLIAIMLFKVVAMATTNAAGGVGGTFAPSLFVGAFAGATIAVICRTVFGWEVSITSFTLAGMAGVMSGVMKAPLTAIFLIAELSNGYGLFIPLMMVSCISFAVNYSLDRDSIYTKQLRMRGELLTHDKDSSAFVFLRLDQLMETDFIRIREALTLGDIVNIISSARRNIFPVVDNNGKLLGVVQLDDLRHDMFNRDKWNTSIIHYMIQPPDKILENEMIQSIMPRFEQGNTWMLPVVDKQGHYLGFISKSRILNAYREALVNVSQAD
jgi:CIC family chloride channel protein